MQAQRSHIITLSLARLLPSVPICFFLHFYYRRSCIQCIKYVLQDFFAFHYTKERLWIQIKASRNHIQDLRGVGYRRNAQRHARDNSKPSKNHVLEIKLIEHHEAGLGEAQAEALQTLRSIWMEVRIDACQEEER